MSLISKVAVHVGIIGVIFATSAVAEPGRGHGHQRAQSHIGHCPPGLAKKNPPCVPPGQARKNGFHYGNRVGEILRAGDYVLIRDPRRYDLQRRQGWSYYRDGNRAYRVDSETRQILAILNLIDAFSN